MRRSGLPRVVFAVIVIGCGKTDAPPPAHAYAVGPRPDELPVLLNSELPFRYPGALYARKAQGNVTLRVFVDRDGRVLADSTRVDEPSGESAFDSAAVAGAPALRFVPAKLHGEPVPLSILFPVYFRHPEARPLPGDTILHAARAAGGE